MPSGYCTTNPTYLHLWLFSCHTIALPLSCPPVLSSLVVNNGGHPGGKEGRDLKQYMCKLKIVMGLLWERFQILIFCVVVAHSFPFLPLCHFALQSTHNSLETKIYIYHLAISFETNSWQYGDDTLQLGVIHIWLMQQANGQAVSQLKNC